jgi:hypothetical protein
MSNYSLSPRSRSEASNEAENSQSLLVLPLILAPPPRIQLRDTQSVLFQTSLFSRSLLDGQPTRIQYTCLQVGCGYTPPIQLLSNSSTSNLWTHLQRHHKQVYLAVKKTPSSPSISSPPSSSTSFFEPRMQPRPSTKYRELLLDFVTSNNLALRVVESSSYRSIVRFLNPTTISISKQTLTRDLFKTFAISRHELEIELQRHIQTRARLSLTTDAWSARNYKDYMAVIVH